MNGNNLYHFQVEFFKDATATIVIGSIPERSALQVTFPGGRITDQIF